MTWGTWIAELGFFNFCWSIYTYRTGIYSAPLIWVSWLDLPTLLDHLQPGRSDRMVKVLLQVQSDPVKPGLDDLLEP